MLSLSDHRPGQLVAFSVMVIVRGYGAARGRGLTGNGGGGGGGGVVDGPAPRPTSIPVYPSSFTQPTLPQKRVKVAPPTPRKGQSRVEKEHLTEPVGPASFKESYVCQVHQCENLSFFFFRLFLVRSAGWQVLGSRRNLTLHHCFVNFPRDQINDPACEWHMSLVQYTYKGSQAVHYRPIAKKIPRWHQINCAINKAPRNVKLDSGTWGCHRSHFRPSSLAQRMKWRQRELQAQMLLWLSRRRPKKMRWLAPNKPPPPRRSWFLRSAAVGATKSSSSSRPSATRLALAMFGVFPICARRTAEVFVYLNPFTYFFLCRLLATFEYSWPRRGQRPPDGPLSTRGEIASRDQRKIPKFSTEYWWPGEGVHRCPRRFQCEESQLAVWGCYVFGGVGPHGDQTAPLRTGTAHNKRAQSQNLCANTANHELWKSFHWNDGKHQLLFSFRW